MERERQLQCRASMVRQRERHSRVDLLKTVLTMTSTVNPPPCDLDMVVLKMDANGGVRLRTDDEQTDG